MSNSTAVTTSVCVSAEMGFLKNTIFNHIHLALLTIILGSIGILVVKYARNPIRMHGNLLILFANIIAISFVNYSGFFLNYARYVYLFYTYKNPCELLTPLWFCSISVGPSYLYQIGYPLLHFCVMLERARATVLAERYERSGQKLGIWMAALIWIFSIAYFAFVVCTAHMDPDLTSFPMPTVTMTSAKYNSVAILWINIGMMVLVIGTALCALRITLVNRRIRKISRNYQDYSLSRNYQLNENALAMRLILPLDIFYALFYTVYQAITLVIRANKGNPNFTSYDFAYFYTLVNTLLFFYSAITIVVYISFMGFVSRLQRRMVIEAKAGPEHTQLYFRQLEAQWQ